MNAKLPVGRAAALIAVLITAPSSCAGDDAAVDRAEPHGPARAAIEKTTVKVMISGGVTAAYRALTPEIERTLGKTLVTSYGASMGSAPDAIPNRLRRGELADVVIMVDDALDTLVARNMVVPDSRVALARSTIGVVVRAGAGTYDISSPEALKRALLAARSVAYSASASGRYVSTELFQRLGIAEEMKGKSKQILSERVGSVVARGEAELGFQQVSELLPIGGITFLGPLPPELQHVTTYAAGVAVRAEDPDGARALIAFLASPAAAGALSESGLEPLTTTATE